MDKVKQITEKAQEADYINTKTKGIVENGGTIPSVASSVIIHGHATPEPEGE